MTIDQVVKYVKDFTNTFNSNVLRSLIYQGIDTNWQPDPDPSQSRFYVAKFITNPETGDIELEGIEELPSNYTIEYDLDEHVCGHIQEKCFPTYDLEDSSYLDYGLTRSDDNITITAKTSSGYDLQVSNYQSDEPDYLDNALTYVGELPQDFYDKVKGTYHYTTITMKAGAATLIFNMGDFGEQ